uniref:BZIP domain-containing protein n=1 Tax=Glycine max TaxID=3847 RepID=A0A0R0FII4_SOYBN
MSPVLSEILRSGFMINSSLRRRTHLVQSFSVVFLYCGTSSTSILLQSSGSEEDLQLLMEQRKKKRKQSNRESARRSRMRKQKHLDDLIAQVDLLKKQKSLTLKKVNITTQHCLKVEAENSILGAQKTELTQSLQSLNDIINLINTTTTSDHNNYYYNNNNNNNNNNFMMNPMHMAYLNQPIVATADNNMFLW